MQIAAADLTAEASYKLMTGIIIPRPIAWVTSMSRTGVVNLAPFSQFMFVAPKPPLIAISIGLRFGALKDTTRNIGDNRSFVVHIANAALLGPVHDSAHDFPPDVSEVAVLGLELEPSLKIAVPRLKACPIAMECRLHHTQDYGDTRNRLIVGEVLMLHIADDVIRDGKVDARDVDPVCRLGGPNYATLGEITTMSTPLPGKQ